MNRILIQKIGGGGLVPGSKHLVTADGQHATLIPEDVVLLHGGNQGMQRVRGKLIGNGQQVIGYFCAFTGMGLLKPDGNFPEVDEQLLQEFYKLPGHTALPNASQLNPVFC